jgi:hypothetical protein
LAYLISFETAIHLSPKNKKNIDDRIVSKLKEENQKQQQQ